jgi:hypothetical protein
LKREEDHENKTIIAAEFASHFKGKALPEHFVKDKIVVKRARRTSREWRVGRF